MTIHVVQPGETVASIAAGYGVDPVRLATDNSVDRGQLAVGQTLVIRFPRRVHTVQPGETLYSISQSYGVSLRQLWRNNWSLGGNTALQPGQQLVISYLDAKLGTALLNGYAYPFIDSALLAEQLPYLTDLAPFTYGITAAGGDPDIVNIVEDTSHQSATEIMQAKGLVDLLIPRGGAGLIRACVRNATVPCIETGTGICHVYVDEYADLDKAVRIIENAKTSRPSVCNAEEVCLVHRAVAARFLPMLKKALVDDRAAQGLTPVELRLDAAAAQIIDGKSASDKDFDTEYLDYILAVGVVDSLDAAIAHVLAHSTHHSDAIVTEDAASAERFINGTDSAATYVNVSTRFTDGGEFGLGCEMGISTQKLHARGPMGLDELSTYKYIIRGDGQIR